MRCWPFLHLFHTLTWNWLIWSSSQTGLKLDWDVRYSFLTPISHFDLELDNLVNISNRFKIGLKCEILLSYTYFTPCLGISYTYFTPCLGIGSSGKQLKQVLNWIEMWDTPFLHLFNTMFLHLLNTLSWHWNWFNTTVK